MNHNDAMKKIGSVLSEFRESAENNLLQKNNLRLVLSLGIPMLWVKSSKNDDSLEIPLVELLPKNKAVRKALFAAIRELENDN